MLLPDMEKALARLRTAFERDEVIGVFGDFDTDGMAGTALLALAFQDLGARVFSYLPDRVEEGHGVNEKALRSLRAQGVSLLVTVDCGSSSVDELAFASSLGMDVIVTDHHSLASVLPETVALINPGRPDSVYPYNGLTGAGLAYKLVEGLSSALNHAPPDYLLELATLGTVADVGPLTGENRYIVRAGLEHINRTQHPGLRALIARSRLIPGSLDTGSLAYRLVPRLNAAGRLGDANLGLDLLTARIPESAARTAEALEGHNDERRRLTEECLAQADQQVVQADGSAPRIIIVEHENWLPGLIGLIAGRLSDRYYRPAVAVTVGPTVSRGSARSVPEFDIVAALRECKDIFHRFGGHPRAAGFTLSTGDLPGLKRALRDIADKKLASLDLAPSVVVDCEISPALLDDANTAFIQSMAPFGEGNPAPVFLTRNAGVAAARRVGAKGDHLKMRVAHGRSEWEAIAFGQGNNNIVPGARIDLVYTVGLNDWSGRKSLQLSVLDFHRSL